MTNKKFPQNTVDRGCDQSQRTQSR